MVKSKIPSSWFNFSKIGEPLQGTNFIACKAPMSSERFDELQVEESEHFTPSDLIEAVRNKGKKLGMVVCCCSTLTYYDPEELSNQGVTQVQVKSVLKNRDKFAAIVNDFISSNPDEDSLIAVHCLHGINRTGYLICSYMAESLGIPVNEAIHRFEIARGHEIETTKRILKQQFV